MKKLLLASLLATLSTTAIADNYRGHRGHSGGDNVLLPLIVGGTLGYIIAQPRTVVVQQPQYTPLPSYVPANNEPIYQYQNIYDGNCACYRRGLVQIN